MSQWENIRVNGLYEVISGYYTPFTFPIEVRAVLASWLEDNVFNSNLDPDNVQHTDYLYGFQNTMLEQLQMFINGIVGNDDQSNWYRQTLTEKYRHIVEQYQNDPGTLFKRIRNCLNQEKQHLICIGKLDFSPDQGQQASTNPLPNSFLTLKNRLNCGVTPRVQGLKSRLKLMADIVVDLGLNRESANQIQVTLMGLQENGLELRSHLNEQMSGIQMIHQQKDREFKGIITELLKEIKALLEELKVVYGLVFNELNSWKSEQRRSGNGFQITRNLDNIEELAKLIAGAVLEINQLLMEAQQLQNEEIGHTNCQYPVDIKQNHKFLCDEINGILQLLATQLWVVERQPSQVLRSKTTPIKPGIKLRLLVGEILNRNETSIVKVSLINESEARKLRDLNYSPKSTIELLQNKKTMRYDTNANTFSVEFTGITFSQKIPRRSKRTAKQEEADQKHKFVAEEKWCFFFSTEFNALGQTFPLRTISCPVSITCHPNQDVAGWGTILWDNAFASDSREPFVVPKTVNCEELLDNIQAKFKSITGRGFTERNRNYIRQTLLRNRQTNGLVSWELFFIEPIEGLRLKKEKAEVEKTEKPVSFWEWIFYIMKLCEKTDDPKKTKENDHFQKYWEAGNIVGFIERDEMTNVLSQSKEGTFMFRFSDTIVGSVTLAWLNTSGGIQRYEPYILDELKKLSLADRVLSKPDLLCVYPANMIKDKLQDPSTPINPGNIPKKKVFSPSPDQIKSKSDLLKRGYILRTVCEVQVPNSTTLTLRSRNQSTASESSSWCSPSPYSQQSASTPGSGSGFGFTSSCPSSVESPDTLTFGSQAHGSSGAQAFGFNTSDSELPDLSLYMQMEDLGFTFDEDLIPE